MGILGGPRPSPSEWLKLLEWFRAHGRKLPWRSRASWYQIVVAEIALIRTRAEVAVRVYNEIIGRYPDPRILCYLSSADELERVFRRIGLPRRGRWLYEAVCTIVEKFKGKPPCRYDELIGLPGFGNYLARVVLANVCGERVAFADTNVVRVVDRLTCGSTRGNVEEWLETSVPSSSLREVNIALLDLAALICKPRQPQCEVCPLQSSCCWALQRT
jgi:A/G-specific adenine glycosylase